MTLKTSASLAQQLSTDIFLLREKLTDQEFKQMMDHMKLLHESINRSNLTKRDLYVKLQDLRKKYIHLSVSFEILYRNVHQPDYIDDNTESFMVVD